jgi:hypothetical protein
MTQGSGADAAFPIVVSLLATGIVASVVNGTILPLVPCLLAAWAAWCVAGRPASLTHKGLTRVPEGTREWVLFLSYREACLRSLWQQLRHRPTPPHCRSPTRMVAGGCLSQKDMAPIFRRAHHA